jgi:hypothetical protein
MTHRFLFWTFLALAAIGTVLPYSQFLPWFIEHGLDLPAFFGQLFSTRIGGFFGWDVIVSAAVIIIFVVIQGRRDSVPILWLPIAGTILVGGSCGLPLFLALRERALDRTRAVQQVPA